MNSMPEMDATKSRISFLSLSAELRNRIYEEVLRPNEKKKTLIWGTTTEDIYQPPDVPAIAQVSQQVRSETMAMHYSDKIFIFPIYQDGKADQLKKWLEIIGPKQAAMVKHLRFEATFSRRQLKRMARDALMNLDVSHKDWFLKAWELDLLAKTCITINFETVADGVLEFDSHGALRCCEYDEVDVLFWQRDDETESTASL